MSDTDNPQANRIDALDRDLSVPSPKAWAAIRSLGTTGTEESLDRLKEIARAADWRYRRSSIEAIGNHPLGEIAGRMVIDALRDESLYVVHTACEAIETLRLHEAHAAILTLLTAKDEYTRVLAAQALSAIWDDADFEIVFRMFLSDRSDKVREAASWVLRQHANSENWLRLVEVWHDDRLARRRVRVCDMARQFGVEPVKDVILSLVDDADGHVRKRARTLLELT